MFYFSKMQATGNDFIVIDYINNKFQYSFKRLSNFLCDRHYGVGGDGILIIDKSLNADFKMRIFNSDGSEAEMCGNGIRCFAKYVYEHKLIDKEEFNIETLAGTKKVKLNVEGKKVLSVKVNMGEPIFEYKKIPIIYDENVEKEINNEKYRNELNVSDYKKDKINILEEKINIDLENDTKNRKILIDNMEFFAISIGNPHVVCFCDNVDNIDIQKIGKKVENYKYFPNKTNVEFVQIINDKNIKVRIWERGVGETLSCGTGVCAATIISRLVKLTKSELIVNTKGGNLKVAYDEKEKNVYLEGEVEEIFKGILNI